MTFIVFFALASLCCVLTVIAVGAGTSNRDTVAVGAILLIVWAFAGICFHAGAYWQRADINETFILTPKP